AALTEQIGVRHAANNVTARAAAHRTDVSPRHEYSVPPSTSCGRTRRARLARCPRSARVIQWSVRSRPERRPQRRKEAPCAPEKVTAIFWGKERSGRSGK